MIHVAAVNASKLTDAEVDAICKALTSQATHHIAPAWDLTTVSVQRRIPVATDWQLAFLEDSDQAGALGYHDELPSGRPLMKVFVATCEQDGIEPSACASHELAEAMVDPDLVRMTDAGSKAWACEVGDPAQSLTYTVDGVTVQDFVFPAWFLTSPPPGAKFCHTGGITKPFQVPSGGYAQWTSDLRGWHSIGSELGAGHTRPSRRRNS